MLCALSSGTQTSRWIITYHSPSHQHSCLLRQTAPVLAKAQRSTEANKAVPTYMHHSLCQSVLGKKFLPDPKFDKPVSPE